MADGDDDKPKLPTVHQWLSEWLGIQLPGLPAMPQTVKNLDKAMGTLVLALADNAKARIGTDTQKVKAGGKIQIDDLVNNAEERRKLENRSAITKVAIEDVRSSQSGPDATSDIDADWLNSFAKAAEDKSSEDLQILFGRILSGEIRKPGSFSLRTLQFASTLSREEAEFITDFFTYAFNNEFVPNLEDMSLPSESARIAMQELGLTSDANKLVGLSLVHEVPPGRMWVMKCPPFGIIIANNSESSLSLDFPSQFLYRSAKDLAVIANSPAADVKYIESVANSIYKILEKKSPELTNSNQITVRIGKEILGDRENMKLVANVKPA